MIVCYHAQINYNNQGSMGQETILFAGYLEDVVNDITNADNELTRLMIMSVADEQLLELIDFKKQVLKHFKEHNINDVPIYPKVGQAVKQFRSPSGKLQFMLHCHVFQKVDSLNHDS